jgi:hypothetical protein
VAEFDGDLHTIQSYAGVKTCSKQSLKGVYIAYLDKEGQQLAMEPVAVALGGKHWKKLHAATMVDEVHALLHNIEAVTASEEQGAEDGQALASAAGGGGAPPPATASSTAAAAAAAARASGGGGSLLDLHDEDSVGASVLVEQDAEPRIQDKWLTDWPRGDFSNVRDAPEGVFFIHKDVWEKLNNNSKYVKEMKNARGFKLAMAYINGQRVVLCRHPGHAHEFGPKYTSERDDAQPHHFCPKLKGEADPKDCQSIS